MDKQRLNELLAVHLFEQSLVADTPAKIGKAVYSGFFSNAPVSPNGALNEMAFMWNDNTHRLHYIESKYNYGGAYGNDGYGLYFWEQRKGTVYQADIEAHVAAWRDKPRDLLTGNGMLVVIAKMQESRWHYSVHSMKPPLGPHRATFDRFDTPSGAFSVADGNEAPMATAIAALKALGVEV